MKIKNSYYLKEDYPLDKGVPPKKGVRELLKRRHRTAQEFRKMRFNRGN